MQDKQILKLEKYCKHWADHNETHKKSFLKWRDIARERGLDSIAEKLNNAMKSLDNCNDFLMSAYIELGKS
ncbi:MAG: hypothetical protein ACXADU_10255 [Promethearchaeota archaeon]